MVTFEVMKYWHKLSAVSGLSPKNIVSDTSLPIRWYAKYRSHFVYHMWSGPHMLIPGTQEDRASSYTLPSIYTLVHTLQLAFSFMIKDCTCYIVI